MSEPDRRADPGSAIGPAGERPAERALDVLDRQVDEAQVALPGERRVRDAAHAALRGERRGLRALLPFLGPAFVAAVAYVDPGNFATNVSSGARFGYTLLWVVLAANLSAMVVQSMSAKLGIATGLNLPEVCRERFPRPVAYLLWVQAEVVAMATDLAEFVGAALGLYLLFGVPLLWAGLLTGAAAFGILHLQSSGFRHLEAVIAMLVGTIVAAFALEVILSQPSGTGVLSGLFTPRFVGTESVVLAAGILGATLMPHVIYLHSALTQQRIVGKTARERRRIFRFELVDVVIAMSIAGLVNMSMLVTAAAVFHSRGIVDVDDLRGVYDGLGQVIGRGAELLFGVGLLASGLSSSSVGTMAGQVVMQGFIRRRIPLFLRRAITMAPALVVLALPQVDPTEALVLSQVVLSFGIPFAVIPLLMFCRDRRLMGELVNHPVTSVGATVIAALIIALNLFLLVVLARGG